MSPNVSDSRENRMDTHKNARLTPKGREEMVRSVVDFGLSKAAAARRFNTTVKTVGKWVERFHELGVRGLRDRSSKPLSSPSQTPQATCTAVEAAASAERRLATSPRRRSLTNWQNSTAMSAERYRAESAPSENSADGGKFPFLAERTQFGREGRKRTARRQSEGAGSRRGLRCA